MAKLTDSDFMKFKLAILASGSGSNAEEIGNYFAQNALIEVALILSNKKDAGVFERASRMRIDSASFTVAEMREGHLLKKLQKHNIDFVVLAGFLLKIPVDLIKAYPNRIFNIHPALLPKFGGKGMYGSHVHKAVIEAGETESGVTIHLVNEEYDKGHILFQGKVAVRRDDTPDDLATRVLTVEHRNYAKVIEDYIISFNEETASKQG